ncbi:MAG: hypothetical protein E7487_01945 [Ruminococcaceae bacterium]|nr:hypothetical protein [Oscillospiraceae bacterium]
MNEPATWERPKTTRRYLHPPCSERMFTLWAEGKLIFGEVIDNREGWEYYKTLESCGVWLLRDGQQFDFKKVKNVITEDGTPIHAVVHEWDGLELCEEAICNTARKSSCFAKVTIKNTSDATINRTLNMMLVTGKEKEIVYGGSDGYISYDPTIEAWKEQEKLWRKEGNVYTDGHRVLAVKGTVSGAWDEQSAQINFKIDLVPGTEAVIEFSLDCGEVKEYDYDAEKAAMQAFWDKELARINKLPPHLSNDPAKVKMIRHMTAQLLQCFARPIDGDYLLPRQGGLLRIIWPTEALAELEALGKIGDFNDYLEDSIATYFDEMQDEEGEIWNIGIYWASVTASSLYTFARYCLDCNRDFYQKYRDKALLALNWIDKTRKSTIGVEGMAGGLFPPLRGNDWAQVFQSWTNNDPWNLLGIKAMVEVTEAMNDPKAAWVREVHDSYLACMKQHFQKFLDAAEGSDELRIPLCPDGNDAELVENYFPLLYHGRFIRSGTIDNERDIRRVYNYMVKQGIAKNGFYGYMPYKDGNRHIWYVNFPDSYWFHIWKKFGEREKMMEILEYQLKYAMTEEYYMIERYADNDPYYVPWSPNASANGRTILMLLEMNQSLL